MQGQSKGHMQAWLEGTVSNPEREGSPRGKKKKEGREGGMGRERNKGRQRNETAI